MPKLKEQDYLLMILRLTSHHQLYEWLDKNPAPAWFPGGRYQWAYNELIIGERIALVHRGK